MSEGLGPFIRSEEIVMSEEPKPVQCAYCRKVFAAGGDMTCGAKVPAHMAAGPDCAWCKTEDIVKMLEKT